MAKRKPYKPLKRYSRSLVVDFFESMHGNTKPCVDGGCPITVAMDERISLAEATTLDPPLVRAIDGFCSRNFGRSTMWEQLTAAEISRITREVMSAA